VSMLVEHRLEVKEDIEDDRRSVDVCGSMRVFTFSVWWTVFFGSVFGGVLAVAMDADHLFGDWSRQTHLGVVVVGGLVCIVVVAFAFRSVWLGMVRN
jgi:hypothetical protein